MEIGLPIASDYPGGRLYYMLRVSLLYLDVGFWIIFGRLLRCTRGIVALCVVLFFSRARGDAGGVETGRFFFV